MTTILNELPFTFYGINFCAYFCDDGEIWLPMQPVCEAMGIDHNGQRQRIQRSKVMGDQWTMLTVQTHYGEKGTCMQGVIKLVVNHMCAGCTSHQYFEQGDNRPVQR